MTIAEHAPRFPFELSIWLTSSFPIGSFAFSHGLEWAAATGRISSRETAASWIADVVTNAGPRNDAIVLADAWAATVRSDFTALAGGNELALALAGSRERYLETTAQGNAFMSTMLAAWRVPRIAECRERITGDVAFPVAVAIASAAYDLPLGASLRAYLASLVVNMTSALVRLSVIGQTDAQRVIAAVMPMIERIAAEAELSTLDDIGSMAFVSDIAAIAHETLDTRLFRT